MLHLEIWWSFRWLERKQLRLGDAAVVKGHFLFSTSVLEGLVEASCCLSLLIPLEFCVVLHHLLFEFLSAAFIN